MRGLRPAPSTAWGPPLMAGVLALSLHLAAELGPPWAWLAVFWPFTVGALLLGWVGFRMTPWAGRVASFRSVRTAQRELGPPDAQGRSFVVGKTRRWPVRVVARDALSPPTLAVELDLLGAVGRGLMADSQESLAGRVVPGIVLGDPAFDAEVRLRGDLASWLRVASPAVRKLLFDVVVYRDGTLRNGVLTGVLPPHRFVLGRGGRGADLLAVELAALAEALVHQWRQGTAALVARAEDPMPGVAGRAAEELERRAEAARARAEVPEPPLDPRRGGLSVVGGGGLALVAAPAGALTEVEGEGRLTESAPAPPWEG